MTKEKEEAEDKKTSGEPSPVPATKETEKVLAAEEPGTSIAPPSRKSKSIPVPQNNRSSSNNNNNNKKIDPSNGESLPGAVPIQGIGSNDDSNNQNQTNNDIDDENADDTNDIESGTGKTTVPDAMTGDEPVVEAVLVVESMEQPPPPATATAAAVGPVYEAKEITPERKKIWVWGCISITLLVVVTLVFVGIFVIAPKDEQTSNEDGTGQPQKQNETKASLTTAAPTASPTLDPDLAQWVPRGDFIHWAGRQDDPSFGHSVALSDDGQILAVAASRESADQRPFSGRIHVYEWDGTGIGGWKHRGQPIDGPQPGSVIGNYGNMVLSGDGNTVAFSSSVIEEGAGFAQVFRWKDGNGGNESSWQWQQLGSDIVGGRALELLGFSLALSKNGNVLGLGAPSHDTNTTVGSGPGKAKIFDLDADEEWALRGDPIDGVGTENLGWAIDLSADGDTVAVSSFEIGLYPNETNLDGRSAVFAWNETIGWSQLGQDIEGSCLSVEGLSLSADGRTVAVSSSSSVTEDWEPDGSGNVRVLELQGNIWTMKGDALFQDNIYDRLAISLSADGRRLVTTSTDDGSFKGRVLVHEWQDGKNGWVVIGQELLGAHEDSSFGFSLGFSADGSTIAIGSPDYTNLNDTIVKKGRVEVYEWKPAS
eukprot:CAMPEP_0113443448 /NCGR_PEP_ID=MMETSP0014_2-20120614/2144_1 /TAXON_ID=2857 /ORGANISM="Nitzschia sp." /LENGTH=650 /DNA_ID=CAMNT_0000334405 /DNA_START=214 /DNA_END=2166 /DNA_ORIENTATION=- /assembly_acc=CAM_ASM_000159